MVQKYHLILLFRRQEGQIRHLRVLNLEGGYSFTPEEEPVKSIAALVMIKMGVAIKSSLKGKIAETRLLVKPLIGIIDFILLVIHQYISNCYFCLLKTCSKYF